MASTWCLAIVIIVNFNVQSQQSELQECDEGCMISSHKDSNYKVHEPYITTETQDSLVMRRQHQRRKVWGTFIFNNWALK